MTIKELIAEIQDMKVKLFDRESELLGQQSTYQDDPIGNKTRQIAELRKQQDLLTRTIEMLREQN